MRSLRRSRKRSSLGAEKCFCAFCRSPRPLYAKKHVAFVDVALCAVAALLLGFTIHQDFDPRAVVFFVIALVLSELFVIFRWRLSIACPHCGFDPVLYKRAPEKAAERVKRFLDLRRQDPLAALAPAPKLPTVVKRAPERVARLRRDAAQETCP
jgi:hypothetical protein